MHKHAKFLIIILISNVMIISKTQAQTGVSDTIVVDFTSKTDTNTILKQDTLIEVISTNSKGKVINREQKVLKEGVIEKNNVTPALDLTLLKKDKKGTTTDTDTSKKEVVKTPKIDKTKDIQSEKEKKKEALIAKQKAEREKALTKLEEEKRKRLAEKAKREEKKLALEKERAMKEEQKKKDADKEKIAKKKAREEAKALAKKEKEEKKAKKLEEDKKKKLVEKKDEPLTPDTISSPPIKVVEIPQAETPQIKPTATGDLPKPPVGIAQTDNSYGTVRLAYDELATSFLLTIPTETKMHYHANHSEHVMLIEGKGMMLIGYKTVELRPNELVFITKGTPHKIINKGKEKLKVLSIQSPFYSGKDIIILE